VGLILSPAPLLYRAYVGGLYGDWVGALSRQYKQQRIMNILQVSNLFNQIAQGLPAIKYYHYGYYSDINVNIQNNFTGENTNGKEFPSVSFLYPDSRLAIKNDSVRGSLNCRLVFNDLQAYDNDSTLKNQSILEQHAELEAIAVNFLSEVNRLSRQAGNNSGIVGDVTFDYFSDAHTDRLITITANFALFYGLDCPTVQVNPASLDAPFNDVPPSAADDYELLTTI
jgi:hypothetical protein